MRAHACEGAEPAFLDRIDRILGMDETRKELTAETQRTQRKPSIADR
jgi:hypothetical protein